MVILPSPKHFNRDVIRQWLNEERERESDIFSIETAISSVVPIESDQPQDTVDEGGNVA